jgi:predicted transcriptional regulator
MNSAYNFIAAWQLFPEKGTYEKGNRPKSGYFDITAIGENQQKVVVNKNWVTLENDSFGAKYEITLDGTKQTFHDIDFATHVSANIISTIIFEIIFTKNDKLILEVKHEIQPNGYLKITETGYKNGETNFTNVEFFHKQMSVLPYSASVSGAVIKPTAQGVIKHKALTAMEEQTNMQLDQIRKQVELLAIQAQEIQSRKELSMIIYNAKLSFQPIIGQVYHLYEGKDDAHFISMVSPTEWGRSGKGFKNHLAKVQLLADHTWKEIV